MMYSYFNNNWWYSAWPNRPRGLTRAGKNPIWIQTKHEFCQWWTQVFRDALRQMWECCCLPRVTHCWWFKDLWRDPDMGRERRLWHTWRVKENCYHWHRGQRENGTFFSFLLVTFLKRMNFILPDTINASHSCCWFFFSLYGSNGKIAPFRTLHPCAADDDVVHALFVWCLYSRIVTREYLAIQREYQSTWLNESERRSLAKGQESPCSTHPQRHCHLSLTECHYAASIINMPVWPDSWQSSPPPAPTRRSSQRILSSGVVAVAAPPLFQKKVVRSML